ncbi:MAG: ATP synthase F1 subunit epsilon [Oscillospiraceae bacterium]|nr:ATP synthase F1 subunit epsilon [Oscillospiraceae bacterium]
MSSFSLTILTPERSFFEGNVQKLVVRTATGDLGILARHEKYVAALSSGPIRLVLEDGTVRLAAISGGMIKVSPERTAILANAAEWSEEIDVARAKRSQEDALRRKESAKSLAEQQRAEAKLRRALNRLKVSGMKTQ